MKSTDDDTNNGMLCKVSDCVDRHFMYGFDLSVIIMGSVS